MLATALHVIASRKQTTAVSALADFFYFRAVNNFAVVYGAKLTELNKVWRAARAGGRVRARILSRLEAALDLASQGRGERSHSVGQLVAMTMMTAMIVC